MSGIRLLANRSSSGEIGNVGPTAEDDVRRAVNRYGEAAVIEAVKKLTTRRGRPKAGGLQDVVSFCEQEAHDMLARGTSKVRTDYAIAKGFADKNPGQSHDATMKRIKRQLQGDPWAGRKCFTLLCAWVKSKSDYPYAKHLQALEALCEADPENDKWPSLLMQARAHVADYAVRHGEPESSLSMEEIERDVD